MSEEESVSAASQEEVDARIAQDFVRFLDALEVVDPARRRRIEPELVRFLARRVGYFGARDSFLRFVGEALDEGERQRRDEDREAGSAADGGAGDLPPPTTSAVGHA
jgi:hypothetical protein